MFEKKGTWWSDWGNVENSCKSLFPYFSNDIIHNDNVIFQNRPEFGNYKDKTILILGGGGSTNSMDWSQLSNYDYLWSVNHFFLHPVLKDIKIDLVMIIGELNLIKQEWLNYRKTFEPLVGFEIHPRWIYHVFDFYDKYFCMHTKYYGKIGACARMMIFACELGVRCIDFIGLDGEGAIKKGNHAFQPGKTTMPTMRGSFEKHYGIFWDYILQTYPDVQFKNLGGGEQYHEIIMRNHSS